MWTDNKAIISDQEYSNIREYLITRWVKRKKRLSRVITIVSSIIIILLGTTIYFLATRAHQETKSEPEPCFGLFFLIVLFAALFIFMFSKKDAEKEEPLPPPPPTVEVNAPYTFAGSDEFFCYHCYKAILTEKIHPINCAVCSTENKFLYLVDKCSRCNIPLRFFNCPHCNKTLDFLTVPYNPLKIKRKLYGQK